MKKFSFLVVMCFLTLVEAIGQRTVSGRVTDENGEGLPGVSVLIKGTTTGVQTDLNGNYTLSVGDGTILAFSYVGFESQEIEVGIRTVIDITMGGATELQEVIVVGFGETSRRELSGSISSIDGEELEGFNATSLDQALQGRSAGVNVQSSAGFLGAPIRVQVRGASSITASSQPLYVIDGTPINSTIQGSTLGGGTGSGTNSLINLNPNDIASIEVLKDASASAIYGARAANGVVIITTKKGRTGKPNVNINYWAGATDYTDMPEYLNGQQFHDMWNDGIRNAGTIAAGDETFFSGFLLPDEAEFDTDWVDEVTRIGFAQEFSANVSGGNETTKYYFGATYNDTENYLIDNDIQRFNLLANIDQQITDKLSVGVKIQPSRSRLNRVSESNNVNAPITLAGLNYPNIPVRDDEGNTIIDAGPNPFGLAFFTSPLINVEESEFITTTTQVLANMNLKYQFADWLSLTVEPGAESWQMHEFQKSGERTIDGQPNGSALNRNTQIFNWNVNTYASVNQAFGDSELNITLGNQIQKFTTEIFSASGQNFPGDNIRVLNGAALITAATGTETEYAFVGYFARANYSYKGKYLVGLTSRYDGSSRFGPDNKWGFFPAASLGWIASDEAFMESITPITFLKLRTSYGRTGNAEIGNFASLTLFDLDGYNGQLGARLGGVNGQLGDPGLTWENTDQLDVAVEFGLFENRVSGSVGYFNKQAKGLLLNVPVSRTVGLANYTSNVGEMTNQGWELDLNVDIIRDGDFTWSLGGNISTIDNEVTSLPDTDGDGEGNDIINGENIIREGEPLSSFFVVPYAGVDRENGDALWFDLEGNTTNSFSLSNRRIEGSPFPDFFGGVTTNFGYKGISLNAFFQFSVGADAYVSDGEFNNSGLSSLFNQITPALDYWTPENPNASQPQPRSLLSAPNGSQNTNGRYLQDASYLRLKTITLAYDFPKSMIGNDYRLRVFVQGQNVLTFVSDEFTGVDPEGNFNANSNTIQNNTFFGAPQTKMWSAGLNFGF